MPPLFNRFNGLAFLRVAIIARTVKTERGGECLLFLIGLMV